MKRFHCAFARVLAVMLLPSLAGAQERSSITGQAIAQGTGELLAGVRVSLPALNVSTVTDQGGRFVLLNVPHGSHTLRMTRIGYRPVTRDVNVGPEEAPVTVGMVADPLRLDALVVTGYGEQRRRDV